MGIIEQDKKYIMNTYARQEVVIVSGSGATCHDQDGKEYIDFGSGIGVNSLGYCDPEWSRAVAMQAQTLQHTSNLYHNVPMTNLAEKLCTETGYQKVFFSNSGAEANECAIKIARKYSFNKYGENRNKIITLVNSFHGRTITTLSATGQDVFHNHFFPFTEGFVYAIANDIRDLKSKLDDSVCAILVEFIQGEGGVVPLDHGFVSAIAKLCDEQDILLIADEVQTGIGRTGKLLASEHYGVKPNVTTLAKGLGGGLPIGATLADEKTCTVFGASDHGTTYGGNPIACAGANVVLNQVCKAEFLIEVTKKGEYLRAALKGLEEVYSIDGIGMMLGICLKTKKASDVLKSCIEEGLIPLTAKDKIRLLPPLNISYEELDKGINILKKVVGSTHGQDIADIVAL